MTPEILAIISEEELEALLSSALSTNGDYYLAIEGPTAMLDMDVPTGFEENGWDKIVVTPAEYDEEGNQTIPAVLRQRTMREFFMTFWTFDDIALVRLCAKQFDPSYRNDRMTEEEVCQFIVPATAMGFPPQNWIVGKEAILTRLRELSTDEA